MGQQGSGIEVHGVTADGLDAGDAGRDHALAEVLGRTDPVAEVVLIDDLAQPGGDRIQVPSGEAAVRRKALGQDEEVAGLLGPRVIVHGQPAADVREPVLLGRHRHPVGKRRHLAHDVGDGVEPYRPRGFG